ncbi:MAG: VPLPA-CTERM sorting domain-containing protein [Paracoccaceae bacterium]
MCTQFKLMGLAVASAIVMASGAAHAATVGITNNGTGELRVGANAGSISEANVSASVNEVLSVDNFWTDYTASGSVDAGTFSLRAFSEIIQFGPDGGPSPLEVNVDTQAVIFDYSGPATTLAIGALATGSALRTTLNAAFQVDSSISIQVTGGDIGSDFLRVGSGGVFGVNFNETLRAEATVEDGDTVSLSASLAILAAATCAPGCGSATVDLNNTLALFLETPLPEGATLTPRAGTQAVEFVLPDRQSVVPLPASAWLLMTGLAALGAVRRRV